ncbi:MAG: aminotransferase class V-fold PLP-dependent enzyme, partial [bacterium]|nr:aminotransferase class V-fold PLP-dependent enzyme [bacterium]
MSSPKGSAFLYARRDVQRMLEPLVVSWGWEAENPVASRFVSANEYQGTKDIAAYLAVPAAIRFMEEHDWPRVRQACHELVRYACKRVTALTGLDPITPDDPLWFAQMATFPLPHCDADVLRRRLYDEFRVEIPIVRWNKRQFVRISVQGYNTRADVDTFIQALAELLPQAIVCPSPG